MYMNNAKCVSFFVCVFFFVFSITGIDNSLFYFTTVQLYGIFIFFFVNKVAKIATYLRLDTILSPRKMFLLFCFLFVCFFFHFAYFLFHLLIVVLFFFLFVYMILT